MNWNEMQVTEYITNQIEESLGLDYKAAGAIANSDGKKKEMSKDVSAMANSNGGVIIYGIKEDPNDKHLPEKIEPINRRDFPKEWLEQVINSNISPRIDGILIHPVPLSSGAMDIVYIIEIPQSSTAHQAADFRYYKRYNFESVPMYDYEVRDIMNRKKSPFFDLEIIYEVETRKIESRWANMGIGNSHAGFNIYKHFNVVLSNKGVVVSNFLIAEIKIPSKLLDSDNYQVSRIEIIDGEIYSVVILDNTTSDITDVEVNGITNPTYKYGPKRYVPILPRLSLEKRINLEESAIPYDGIIYWTIYADDAEPRGGSIMIAQIKLENSQT